MEVVKEDMKLGGLDGGRRLAVETPEGKEEKKRGNRVSAFMCSNKCVVSVVWRPAGIYCPRVSVSARRRRAKLGEGSASQQPGG